MTQKACEEVLPVEQKKDEPKATEVDPSEDLSVIDGITKSRMEKLSAIKITKKSELVAALKVPEKQEELKGILGAKYEAISTELLPVAAE